MKNLPLFQGAIPSKVFEALAMEVPLLLGVDGEARKHFIEKGNAGLFFQPENAEDAAKQALFLAENPEKRVEIARHRFAPSTRDTNRLPVENYSTMSLVSYHGIKYVGILRPSDATSHAKKEDNWH